jgi:hypothetical protein
VECLCRPAAKRFPGGLDGGRRLGQGDMHHVNGSKRPHRGLDGPQEENAGVDSQGCGDPSGKK